MYATSQKAIRRQANLAAGLCRCGRAKPDGYYQCDSCRDGDRARRARALASGLCRVCHKNEQAPDGGNCYSCRNKLVARAARHREEGNCSCGKPLEAGLSYCESCFGYVWKKYGWTAAMYTRQMLKQGGKCAICREPPGENRRLDIDHNHRTGKVRELLCVRCNAAIGMMRESPKLLKAAIAYLRRHNGDA